MFHPTVHSQSSFVKQVNIFVKLMEPIKLRNSTYILYLNNLFLLCQGWELTLLLIFSTLFRSKLLILKSDCERFPHVALYKRAAVSKLLSSLFKME